MTHKFVLLATPTGALVATVVATHAHVLAPNLSGVALDARHRLVPAPHVTNGTDDQDGNEHDGEQPGQGGHVAREVGTRDRGGDGGKQGHTDHQGDRDADKGSDHIHRSNSYRTMLGLRFPSKASCDT